MKPLIIDSEITLIPYYPNYDTALPWYQDLDVCRQVDNIDCTYSLERLQKMYSFLSTHGDCFYIQYQGVLVGDVKEWIRLPQRSILLTLRVRKCFCLSVL